MCLFLYKCALTHTAGQTLHSSLFYSYPKENNLSQSKLLPQKYHTLGGFDDKTLFLIVWRLESPRSRCQGDPVLARFHSELQMASSHCTLTWQPVERAESSSLSSLFKEQQSHHVVSVLRNNYLSDTRCHSVGN